MFSEIVSAHVYYPFKLAGTKFCSVVLGSLAPIIIITSIHENPPATQPSPAWLKTFYFFKKLIFNLFHDSP